MDDDTRQAILTLADICERIAGGCVRELGQREASELLGAVDAVRGFTVPVEGGDDHAPELKAGCH